MTEKKICSSEIVEGVERFTHRWVNGREIEPGSGIYLADCAKCGEQHRYGPGVADPDYPIKTLVSGIKAILAAVKSEAGTNPAATRMVETLGFFQGKIMVLWHEFSRTKKG